MTIIYETGHENKWPSQPHLNRAFAGNILLVSGILYSGNTFSRITAMMKIANALFFSHTLYLRTQKINSFPRS